MEEEKKKLADAPVDKTFITHLGKEVKNLKDLSKTLEETPSDSFKLHVNDQKNDFANWIKQVLMDNELSEELYKTKDFKKTKDLIKARIEWLEKQISSYESHEESSNELTKISEPEKSDDEPPRAPPQEEIAKAIEEVSVPKPLTPPEVEPHPFVYMKNNIVQAFLGGFIGFIIGAVVGAVVIYKFVCGCF